MLLAQAPPLANDLYHEWGLWAGVIALSAIILPGLWWLLQLNSDETVAAALKIRSALAGVFQSTVVNEALRLFDLVDGHLAYSLSQSDRLQPRPSAFDKLVEGLNRLDPEDPNRDIYREIIENALSGVIVSEIRKLLQLADVTAVGALDRLRNPTGLTFGFEGTTERTLIDIARKTVQANKKEKRLSQHKTWALYSFLTAAIAGFLSTPFYFFNAKWAFVGCVVTLSTMAVGCILALVNLGLFHRCKIWIEKTACMDARPDAQPNANNEGLVGHA